jgi:glycosyltransferase involved in cell wall biosynthesis
MAKLLLVIPNFTAAGGTERMVAELAKLLARDHEVAVCSFDPAGAIPKFSLPCAFVPLGESRRLPLPFRWITYLAQARRLASVKRNLGTELSISNLWRSDLISLLSGGCDRKIALAHINVVGNPTNRMLLRMRSIVGAIYRRFSAVVTVSEALAAELIDIYGLRPERVHPIANFVSDAAPAQPRPRRSGRPTLLWCGRFVPEKNVDALVTIFRDINAACPSAQLVLVGEGPTREAVAQAASREGLCEGAGPALVFAGQVEDARVMMDGADLLLLPSRAEGLPMVLLESLAAGVPVLAADCPSGGVRQVLGGKTPHDPNRFAERTSCGVLLPVPGEGNEHADKAWIDEALALLNDGDRLAVARAGALERAKQFSPGEALMRWRAVIAQVLR